MLKSTTLDVCIVAFSIIIVNDSIIFVLFIENYALDLGASFLYHVENGNFGCLYITFRTFRASF